MPVILPFVGISTGTRHTLAELGLAREEVEFLMEDGFEIFIQSEYEAPEMMSQAIQETLALSGTPAAEIDAVVLGSESFWEESASSLHARGSTASDRLRDRFADALRRGGLEHAYPYANWLSACANFGSCLALARSLITAAQHRKVLLVLADRVTPNDCRIQQEGTFVCSDIAAACIVCDSAHGYRVNHTITHSALSLPAPRDADDDRAPLRAMTCAMRSFDAKVRAATGRRLRDYRCLVADNLHRMFLRMMCKSLDLDVKQLLMPTKAAIGHAFSADCLLSLRYLHQEGKLRDGDAIGLLNIGVSQFCLVDLTVMSGPQSAPS